MKSNPAKASLAALIVPIALAAPGCGGGGETIRGTGLPPGHEGVEVISRWVGALSRGDVSAAAKLFALPAVVENGTPPIRLRTREDAVVFNRSLPCGGRLVGARPEGRFIAATFRLTDRPGGACGSGEGTLARAEFLIRAGKIAEWRRLPDRAPATGPSGPIV
ncbi:MAG: hypothetical protein U0R52_13875 [Solirubrobacterales bacterium]